MDMQKPSETKGSKDLTRSSTLCDVASGLLIFQDRENVLYSQAAKQVYLSKPLTKNRGVRNFVK